MKIGITREMAESVLTLIDQSKSVGDDAAQGQDIELFRDRLAKRLNQTAAVHRLTATELTTLIGVIDDTYSGEPHMPILRVARAKLQVMLDAYRAGDDDD